MANLAMFKSLLAKEAQASNGLPCVTLKQGTDLGQAFARVVSLDNRRQGETNEMLAARYVDEFCKSMDNPANSEALDLFDKTCAAFAEKIRNAWTSLAGIKEQAKELSADMEKLSQELISKDSYVSSHAKFMQLSEDFPVFSWDGTKVMGTREDVARDINSLVVADSAEIPTTLDKRLFDLVIANIDKHTAVTPVNVTEEERSAIIDQLKELCPDTPAETVAACADYMFGIRKYSDVASTLKSINTVQANAMFDLVKRFDAFVLDNYPVVDAVISDQVKLAPENKEVIVNNACNMLTLCKLAAYYEAMQRTTVYRESVLLQGGLINADVKESFEQAGGNNGMLARHVRLMYNDDLSKVPAMGVRGDSIVQTDAAVSAKVEENIANISNRIALTKTNMRVTAFKKVAMDYIGKVVERANEGIDPVRRSNIINDDMAKVGAKITDAVRQYNVGFMDAALDLIVSLNYNGSFVEVLKNRLGAAYLALANSASTESVTDEKIQCAEVSVVADLICEFIANRMIEVAPCQERPVLSEDVQATPPDNPEVPVQSPDEIKKEPGAAPAQES